MQKVNIFLSLVLLFCINGSVSAQTQTSLLSSSTILPTLSPDLEAALAALPPDGRLTVIVSLREGVDLSQFEMITTHSRHERRTLLLEKLKNQANVSQKDILAKLQAWLKSGEVDNVIPFWIFNGISIQASEPVIRELSQYPEVLQIAPELTMHAPVTADTALTVNPNLDRIGVEKVWEQGFLGQGVVIASLDTGVDYSHPDLIEQWRGGTNSWFDPFGEHPDTPADAVGHGTWTMGVMIGGDASGQSVGVAPQAQWISAKVFDDAGIATETAIHQSFQWILDPDGDPDTDDAPDVINNSWGFDMAGCITNMQKDLQALRAAGILPIFSAGNSGPLSSSSVSPANNPEALSVGATNNDDAIHTTSSRGPSACDPEAVYPILVAPGDQIYTTGLNNEYSSHSGTSLSAPHIAGALALLLSAQPDLTVREQERLLIESSVDLGDAGPDTDFGYGRLDVWEAFLQLSIEQVPNQSLLFFLPFLIHP